MAVAALALAPVAGAADPGRNGSVAYPETFNNGSVETESAINSIPQSSAVNCQGTNSDGSDNCDIGRFGYSPNGKQIVAARSGQLAMLDSHGGDVQLLKALTSDDEQPAFLPGGQTIVFAGRAGNQTNLYEVATDGTGLKQLTTKGDSWPAPCANGTIAYVNRGALYLMRADGSHVRWLVKRNVSTPDCAPNSRSIVYQGRVADFIVKTSGGKPRRVAGGATPVFSPDGKRIASVEDLPDVESGGSSVQTIVVVKQKNGHRIRKQAIGDAAGAETIGALTWPSSPA